MKERFEELGERIKSNLERMHKLNEDDPTGNLDEFMRLADENQKMIDERNEILNHATD